MWPMLNEAIPKEYIADRNKQDLYITLKGYNSTIHLVGADNPDSLRGITISFLVCDEIQDISLDTIDMVLGPAMISTKADGIYIGTPKGKGNNTAYQLYMRGKTDPDWKSWQFTTAEGGNVPEEEIEAARRRMSAKQFRQELCGSFETMEGRVYYAFDINESVTDEAEDTGGVIHVGMDFNVGKMCASLCTITKDNNVHIFDEIVIENSNTREMCHTINNKYPKRDIVIYPDPAGKARKTSADVGQTDFTIIKSEFGWEILARSSHSKIADRVNNVNSMLLDADNNRRLLVHPRCREVVACLDGQTYKEGTSIPDKTQGLDHMCFSGDTLVEVFGRGLTRFDEIPESGFVKDYSNTWVEYTKGGLIDIDSKFILLSFDGYSIKCTPDHKFLTTDGWVEAINLVGKDVITCKSYQELVRQYKYTKEKNTTYAEATFKERVRDYIGRYLPISLVKYLKDSMYTIKMVIGQTTNQATCSYCVHPSTQDTTIKRIETYYPKVENVMQGDLSKDTKSGVKQKPLKSGLKSTMKTLRKSCTEKLNYVARHVVKCLTLLLGIKNKDFVQKNAKHTTEDCQELMKRKELAQYVTQCLKPTNMQEQKHAVRYARCNSIKTLENQPSYCLTTVNGSFSLPNGTIVSNCDALGYFIDYKFNLVKREAKVIALDWSY